MSDNPLVAVERTIVDWFEANHFTMTERDGEWFFISDEFEFSVTELATAVAASVTPKRS